MPRRLAIPVIACIGFLGLAGRTANADAVAPVRGFQLESPVHFVLPPRPVSIPLGQQAVRLARQQLGVPYRWGGSSPSGFDCSGLVSWVYGRLGVGLPHNAAALYGVGRRVRLSSMRPGDLVFFSGLGHVGIYIGGGQFVHAPHTGDVVRISSLGDRMSSYVGARRL